MKKDITGICLLLGLVFLGLMIPAGVRTFRSFDRTVSVKGLCECEVPADKVVWPISFNVVGDNLSAVYSEIESKNSIIRKFLKDGGIADDAISAAAPRISDKFTQEYGSNDRQYRYIATNTITVCSSEVEKVKSLMNRQAELIKKDIVLNYSWDSTPEYRFEGLNGIKPSMIETATKNAREVALKFAEDSGSRLGKIREATQGTFSIENRDGNTPDIKKVRVVTYVTYYLSK